MQWNLEQLRQFVATAEHGSISAAARHLGKAQSAVSTALGLLEADLGVVLFDRSKHRATLTDAGQIMLLEARELLRQAQALNQRALALATRNDGKLALALDEVLPRTAIRMLARDIACHFPELELTLLNGTATEVADYVDQERADLGFHFNREPLRERFDERHIGALNQGLFVSEGHDLLQKKQVSRTDLARYRQLVMHSEDIEENVYSPRVWRVDNFHTIAEMVADGLGWAVLPAHIAAYGSHNTPLCQVYCPFLDLPQLSVRMLWCQGSSPGVTAHWVEKRFMALLQQ
ncbi:LysR family transcriptional regulator [Oceanimonas smirnovii]|uniref:LysR family transcriptional regulator n=1 Tax=Oceanimonas smirnovii TaxID=264574 RepID=UPI00376F820F